MAAGVLEGIQPSRTAVSTQHSGKRLAEDQCRGTQIWDKSVSGFPWNLAAPAALPVGCPLTFDAVTCKEATKIRVPRSSPRSRFLGGGTSYMVRQWTR